MFIDLFVTKNTISVRGVNADGTDYDSTECIKNISKEINEISMTIYRNTKSIVIITIFKAEKKHGYLPNILISCNNGNSSLHLICNCNKECKRLNYLPLEIDKQSFNVNDIKISYKIINEC